MTNEELIAAYRETGSVWAAGKRLGCAGQTVHKKLRRLGIATNGGGGAWTPEEEQELRRLVEDEALPFLEVGNRLDRSFASVAVRASRLGLKSTRSRERKPKRGQGLDKAAMSKHMTALERGERLTPYVRRSGLKIGPFVRAMQLHFPQRWEAFAQSIGLEPKTCVYCERIYYPTSGRQRYCEQRCNTRAHSDREYFGGRRRLTVGWDQGQCQLCGERPQVGLSSHHIFGKQNDPDNQYLMALCRGCHDVVTRLAARKWATDEAALQRLVFFTVARNQGARYMTEGVDRLPSVSVEVDEVEIDCTEIHEIGVEAFS